MTVLAATAKYPPLVPTETGERQFYHYRKGVIVEILIMRDNLAIWRREHGQDLWPCEWGIRPDNVRVK